MIGKREQVLFFFFLESVQNEADLVTIEWDERRLFYRKGMWECEEFINFLTCHTALHLVWQFLHPLSTRANETHGLSFMGVQTRDVQPSRYGACQLKDWEYGPNFKRGARVVYIVVCTP